MIHGFTDTQVIATLGGFIVASYLAFFGWLVTSLRDLRNDVHELNRETRLELGGRVDALSTKVDAVAIAVSRLEGAVYHGLPEPRRAAE
jgi:hypothetical protein